MFKLANLMTSQANFGNRSRPTSQAPVAKPPRPTKNPLRYTPLRHNKSTDSESEYAATDSFLDTMTSSGSSFMSAAPSLSDCYSMSSGGYSSLGAVTPPRTRAGSCIGMDSIEEHGEDASIALSGLQLRAPKWLATCDKVEKDKVETIAPTPVRLRAPGRIDLQGLQNLSPNTLGLRSLTEPSNTTPQSARRLHGLGFDALDATPSLEAQNSCLWRPNMYDPIDEDEEPYPDIFEPRPAAPRHIDVADGGLDCISPLALSEDEIPSFSLDCIGKISTPRAEQDARALRFFRSDIRRVSKRTANATEREPSSPVGVMDSPPLETVPLPNPYSPFVSSPCLGTASPRLKSNSTAHFASKLSKSSDCPVPPSLRRVSLGTASPALSFPNYCPSPRLVDPYPSPIIMPSGPSSGLYPPLGMSGYRRNLSAGDLLFKKETELLGPSQSRFGCGRGGSEVESEVEFEVNEV